MTVWPCGFVVLRFRGFVVSCVVASRLHEVV